MNRKRNLPVQDLNRHLLCSLCNGYLIDATTIIECLHSFCRACIVRYLESHRFCPVCDVQIHKTNPLLNIRKDATLQALVYKLVPGLYQNEMRTRRVFADQHPEAGPSKVDDRSDDVCIFTPEEYFSLSLDYWKPIKDIQCNAKESTNDSHDKNDTTSTEKLTEVPSWRKTRYFRCPAAVTVKIILKLIRGKHGMDPSQIVELLIRDEVLPEHLTLVDVAYIYKWNRNGPLSLSYRVYKTRYHESINLDTPSTASANFQSPPSEPCLVDDATTDAVAADTTTNAVATDVTNNPLQRETAPTDKSTNWQEVQLQISETGIMSVSGISVEHNNNLDPPNNNIFDNQTEVTSENSTENLGLPKYLTLVDNYSDKIGTKHQELVLPKLKLPRTGASKQEVMRLGSSCESAISLVENTSAPLLSNQASVGAEGKEKKSCPKGKMSKGNIQNVSELVDDMRSANACTRLQPANLQNVRRQKLADVPVLPKELIKPASDSQINRDNSKPIFYQQTPVTQPASKKEPLFLQPIRGTSNMAQKDKPGKICDAKNYTMNSFTVTPISTKVPKMDVGPASLTYNTLKDSPNNWNPSLNKASYPILKPKPSISGSNVNNNSEAKTEKAPNFFKMKNMPRYLGNPASGVKPMYQLSDHGKAPHADLSTRNKNVVMKIDPKTLSPIISATTSESLPSASESQSKSDYKLSHPFSSQKGSTESINFATCAISPEFASLKKLSSEKRKSAGGDQDSLTSILAMNSSPALTNSKSSLSSASAQSFKMSHARSIPATESGIYHHEFCNDVPVQRPLSGTVLETASATSATSGIKFNNAPNFSINPATLNLLSSNLSFLPNPPNFLFGNYADYGPPLVRPGLNRSGCLGVIPSCSTGGPNSVVTPVCVGSGSSGLPAGMGAYHSMPPSINMLFPHHRSTERERSGSTHGPVHTPAVQRIPASKGTTPTGSHKQNTGKKISLAGNKASQVQTTNSSKNIQNEEVNEWDIASGAKSDVLGTLPHDQKTVQQASNMNNNLIIGADNIEIIDDKKLPVIENESSMQKDVMMPNIEKDSSICVTLSDTHYGSETNARKEIRVDEEGKDTKEKQRPLTDLSIKIKTGDKRRNLNEEISDNNNKKVKFSSVCLESSSPIKEPDVITKPCTDPRCDVAGN